MRIYIIGDSPTRLKIGISEDCQKRLRELQTGNPNLLTLYWVSDNLTKENAYVIEQLFHKKNNFRRIKNEWFDLDLELAKAELLLAVNSLGIEENIKHKFKQGFLRY
jgi:hypothetical protein